MNDSALLPAVEIEPEGPHRATVIWLHGLGADGHDFEPLAAELQLPAALGVRFLLPHAPRRPVSINAGTLMRAWYDIVSPDLSFAPDRPGIQASRQAVARLAEREMARGIPPERIVLAGFSQGGVIALETMAHHPQPWGGVIALSTYVALPDTLPAAPRPVPIFMAHGTLDTVVPYTLGAAGRALLEAKGYAVEWHTYPMPHSVCWEEIRDIGHWLARRLSAP
ncbi:alpha/beta hydrolase [Candidatus Methylocalor cossyra]|uniref:Carboxylesterase 1 n=1 Tax=Candidatus Methylocalor cossyra TaxID=3108543 RepID=A0ABM9NE58_9GAMM